MIPQKIHQMRLNNSPFQLIKSGSQKIESRLNDKKRQALRLGDKIEFTNRDNSDEKIVVEIIDILRYPTFKELYTEFPPETLTASDCSVEQLVKNMQKYYSKEDELIFGVLGLKLKL